MTTSELSHHDKGDPELADSKKSWTKKTTALVAVICIGALFTTSEIFRDLKSKGLPIDEVEIPHAFIGGTSGKLFSGNFMHICLVLCIPF
jgi:hypothetical protein